MSGAFEAFAEKYFTPEAIAAILMTAGGYLLRLAAIIVLWRIASAVLKRFIDRLAASWRARGSSKRADTLAAVLRSLSNYTLGSVGICAILGVFNIPVASVLAVAGVGSVAIGFGAQSLVKDVITGFFILFEGQFGVGDIVTITGTACITGTVEAIGLRTTRIRGFDGSAHIFPNSQILFVTNQSGGYRHAIVDLHINFDERVFAALCDEMRQARGKLAMLTSEPAVLVTGEPADGNIRIIAECPAGENAAVSREIVRLAADRLEAEGVEFSVRGDQAGK